MSDRGERQSLLLPILIPVGGLAAIVLVLYLFSRVLLSVKPNAATAVALVVAAGIMTVAAFVASRRSVTGASLGSFVGAAAGIAMAAGGIAIVVIGPPEEEIPPFHAVLAAPEGAVQKGFATPACSADALRLEAALPIELEFDNQDPGVGHNVQIFDGPDDTAPIFFNGDALTGPAKAPYSDRAVDRRASTSSTAGSIRHHDDRHGHVDRGSRGGSRWWPRTRRSTPTRSRFLRTHQPRSPSTTGITAAHNLSIYEDETASGDPLFHFRAVPWPRGGDPSTCPRSRRAATTSTATCTRR